MILPPAPPGGGILVLNPAQYSNAELRAMIALMYPQTEVIQSKFLPVAARRFIFSHCPADKYEGYDGCAGCPALCDQDGKPRADNCEAVFVEASGGEG